MLLEAKIKRSTIWAFCSIVLYKIALDAAYYFVISRVWDYAKFELHFNSVKLIESYFLLFIIFIFMPKSSQKLSRVMAWLFILLSYIPMLTLFALKDESRIFMWAVTGFWLLIFVLLYMPIPSLPSLKQRQAKIIRFLLSVILSLIVFLMLYKYLGLSFSLNLEVIYDIRAHYTKLNIPLAGYFFGWVAHIINPVLFGLFLKKRKWLPIILIITWQILLFSATGNRTFLFALPFTGALIWIVSRQRSLTWMAIGLCVLILLGMASYWLLNDIYISSLLTRRTLLVPAHLSFYYYDFFSQNDHTYLSQHRGFRIFTDYPYNLKPPRLIAKTYFNKPEMRANNGIIADAYMNFGFIGLILWAIVLLIILRLIDSLSKNKDMRITIAAIAMLMISLVNSPMLTNLLTHGLLLALVVLYLLPRI